MLEKLLIIWICISVRKLRAAVVPISCDEFGAVTRIDSLPRYRGNCTFSFSNVGKDESVSISNPKITDQIGFEHDFGNGKRYDVTPRIYYSRIIDSSIYTLPYQIFEKFPNLESFTANQVEIREINKFCFENAVNLKYLSLAGNSIETLEEKLFSSSVNLTKIYLGVNRINQIAPTAFSNLKNLKELLLNHNNISEIKAEHLEDLVSLELIDLSSNKFEAIAENLFENNKNLTTLDLNDNQLKVIGKVFDDIPALDLLVLQSNLFEALDLRSCKARRIYAENNSIKTLSISDKVLHLSANNNQISSIDIEGDNPQIQYLNVSSNQIKSETLSSISKMKSLSILDLSYNEIGRINLATFEGLHNLVALNLQSTKLSGINYGTFTHQTKLEELDLSYNELKVINTKILAFLKELTTLYIDGNFLKSFEYKDIRLKLPKLKKIAISDNSFNCSYLTDMVTSLKHNKIAVEVLRSVTNTTNVNGISCHDTDSPEAVLKNPLKHSHLHENETSNFNVLSGQIDTILEHVHSTKNEFISKDDFYSKVSDLKNVVLLVKADLIDLKTEMNHYKLNQNLSIPQNGSHANLNVEALVRQLNNITLDKQDIAIQQINLKIAEMQLNFEKKLNKYSVTSRQNNAEHSPLTTNLHTAQNTPENSDNTIKVMIVLVFVMLVVICLVNVYFVGKWYLDSKTKNFPKSKSRSETNFIQDQESIL